MNGPLSSSHPPLPHDDRYYNNINYDERSTKRFKKMEMNKNNIHIILLNLILLINNNNNNNNQFPLHYNLIIFNIIKTKIDKDNKINNNNVILLHLIDYLFKKNKK